MTTPRSAQPDPPLVRARGLAIGYGLPVCPPIDVTVARGAVLAVVGANGTGKSTLLRTVVGLLDPLAGEVEVLGAEVDERSRRFRTEVAAELGDEAFFPALTVREHLLLTCHGHGVARPGASVDALLAEFGLASRADALPSALSSGQRRRLRLASVFARPRSLLVLDEPEQRLDAGMRGHVADLLLAERRRGGAVLVATHDPALVRRAATAALVLGEDVADVVSPEVGSAAIEAL